jgi:hypothetical protein
MNLSLSSTVSYSRYSVTIGKVNRRDTTNYSTCIPNAGKLLASRAGTDETRALIAVPVSTYLAENLESLSQTFTPLSIEVKRCELAG